MALPIRFWNTCTSSAVSGHDRRKIAALDARAALLDGGVQILYREIDDDGAIRELELHALTADARECEQILTSVCMRVAPSTA